MRRMSYGCLTKYMYIWSYHLNNRAMCVCGVIMSEYFCMIACFCCVCLEHSGIPCLSFINVVNWLVVGMFLYLVVAVRRYSSSMYLTRLHPFQELISKYNTFDTHNNSFYKVAINYFFMLFSTTMCAWLHAGNKPSLKI